MLSITSMKEEHGREKEVTDAKRHFSSRVPVPFPFPISRTTVDAP